MPLTKAKGNMYPWVTHTHTHLGGECLHRCKYCYVDSKRFGRPKRYRGSPRLIDAEFNVNYGSGKTIFLEHCNDLFASNVFCLSILAVLGHAVRYPDNTYVFQTKNPKRYFEFIGNFPDKIILGTTIETNRNIAGISNAPDPEDRMRAMELIGVRKFVTIEPVLDFDVDILAPWIARIRPEFLNLGADSKANGLPEPSVEKIMKLVTRLKEYGIDLREKHNLKRLKPI